ncbi:MAG: hypothetical protein BGO48_07360 [Mucilaginibacter sp. 44-25]|nr:MAG: hypothetical protein BGO48_07360 [Mucilaginibacter sp. 44-25]
MLTFQRLRALARTSSLLLYITLKNIKSFFNSIEGKVAVLKGLDKTFYGATGFSIIDNNNYVITFAEHEA